MKRLRILRICFVVYGLLMAAAIFFVFIPNESMIRIGLYYNLPNFEVTPVFEYMARGMSSICFLVGMILIYLGLHLRQYTPLVRFLGWLALVSLPMIVFIHAKITTPFWWKVGDITGVFVLVLMCFAVPQSKTET